MSENALYLSVFDFLNIKLMLVFCSRKSCSQVFVYSEDLDSEVNEPFINAMRACQFVRNMNRRIKKMKAMVYCTA